MKLFDGYCGSDGVKEQLERLITTGLLPHAILLGAEYGTGRNYFARLIAEGYLNDNNGLVRRGVHPDCVTIRGSGKSGEIPVDEVREAIYEMNKSAVMADGKRVVIVEDAEHLNNNSSTALLKTLEQPSDGVIFILTVGSKDEVIDTISSRCVEINLLPPDAKQATSYLEGMRKPKEYDRIGVLSELFRGRIGLVLRALDDKDFKEAVDRAERFTSAFYSGDRLLMLSVLDEIKDRKDMSMTLFVTVFCLGRQEWDQRRAAAVATVEGMRKDIEKNVPLKLFSTVLVERICI